MNSLARQIPGRDKESEMQVIEVTIKNVYGQIKVYPANEAAQLIANIAGTKTLSNQQLAYAERLGFQIKQVEAYQLKLAA